LHVMPLAKLLVTIFKNAKLPSRPWDVSSNHTIQ
jgi:hypothetical protein